MHTQNFGDLSAITLAPPGNPNGALVLLHGVGSNERNMLELGPILAEDRLIVSLRGPLVLGANAFAWFHVQFTAHGPIHNWDEAKKSLQLIEEALLDLSDKTKIPLEKISIFGFSQGAIMTIGLALQSELPLEKYIASSGRTLPEFAQASEKSPLASYRDRKIFIGHGEYDSKLPVALARNTERILRSADLDLIYKEYPADHSVSPELITDARKWLKSL
ncbi:alpha/beta hydrolase [Bdellovibrio reynosensis]|uniref:Serine esterase n=1 Tax=Bdellovibrio reynosensis TaxID=2835041 RepID=A0ABY4CDB5_9BACT|nr:serine esterase [Bdellovibrio reynosensis]UOF02444.1 serine esterase [Bdellovibrio reynosensis]